MIAYGAKVIAITSHELLDLWHQLEIVMGRWRDIERIRSEDPGPRMFSITRTSVRRLL